MEHNPLLITPRLNARQLPALFENAVCTTDYMAQQDMLLLGMATTISHIMPKFYFRHGYPSSRTYGANLMSLIIAPAASGKGVLNHAGHVVDWSENILPGNASISAFLNEFLRMNGHALLFETEADVMSKALHQQNTDYSYVLRQAWEQETIRRARDGKDKHRLVIREPHLSVLLSGTFDQLRPLLRSRSNGLTSRFITYLVNEVPGFDARVFGQNILTDSVDANRVFTDITTYLQTFYQWQLNANHSCEFVLTDAQQERITEAFCDFHTILIGIEHFPLAIDSCLKRLAVNIMRLGMVLNAVRLDTDDSFPHELVCTDDDFATMLAVAESLIYHLVTLNDLLPEEDMPVETTLLMSNQMAVARERRDAFFSTLPDDFSTRDALTLAQQQAIPAATIEKWLIKWKNEAVIVSTQHGKYSKTSK